MSFSFFSFSFFLSSSSFLTRLKFVSACFDIHCSFFYHFSSLACVLVCLLLRRGRKRQSVCVCTSETSRSGIAALPSLSITTTTSCSSFIATTVPLFHFLLFLLFVAVALIVVVRRIIPDFFAFSFILFIFGLWLLPQ